MFTSSLDAALRYADRGWFVLPTKPDKTPYCAHGCSDATRDESTIIGWWRRWPDAGVGIAAGPSGLLIVDLDIDGTKKDGIATWELLKQLHGNQPDWCALMACTPRGGRHLFYRAPLEPITGGTDREVGVRAHNTQQSGIDIRAGNYYVIAPSPASPGRDWVIGDWADADDLVDLPAWLDPVLRGGRSRAASAGAGKGVVSTVVTPLAEHQVHAIREALRHLDPNPRDEWIRAGMALRSTGAGVQAYDIWSEWSKASPKYDEAVQQRQWDSLREYFLDGREVTLGTLFHRARENGYTPPASDIILVDMPANAPKPQTMPGRRAFPTSLMQVPGLVGDVAGWLLSCSRRPQPALCLASAIATMGAVLGRRVATSSDLRTNVYVLGIGETGCGKDAGVRLPRELLCRANLSRFVGPGSWKSDAAIRSSMAKEASQCVYVDEFAKQLELMTGRLAPSYLKGIKSVLLELWGASAGVSVGAAYANPDMNPPKDIEQPNLCFYGTGVPAELFASLDRGAMADGFLNRLLVFWADDQLPAPQKVGRAEPPEALVASMRQLDALLSDGGKTIVPNAGTGKCDARMLAATTDAEDLLAELDAANDERIRRMRREENQLADLWIRFAAHVQKMALIRSASIDPRKAIELEDVAWARDLVVWCLERTMIEAEARVADSEHEAQVQRVRRLVTEAGPDGISMAAITRKTQWLRGHERKDILQTLVASGDIVQTTVEADRPQGGGSPATTFRAAQFAQAVQVAQAQSAG